MRRSLDCASEVETAHFARALAANLRAGDLLLLEGPLGAGKTYVTQALIKSLGVSEQVTSPTFVIVKSYQGALPIHHIDAYRLLDAPDPRQAFDELDIDVEGSVTIVEWGKNFDVTGSALHIEFEIGPGQSRTLTLEGPDARWGDLQV
ncbi:MAG: tRNA (adenosine(37)-N6)-threonylcarbamoyltransferase complex ATPase subunit type 1 TsaE [Actinobacteria bacterium]|nr:tRNA (adenosine(37)-N6)-threonylcarbamoyltransferase complex ATPase subunit type 1 TsaE [Actinomycetota bacterium]